MLTLLVLTLMLSCPACSPLEGVVKSLTEAQATTQQIDEHLANILAQPEDTMLVVTEAKAAKDLNEEVHDGISRAIVSTTKLQDKPNEWLKALTLWGGVIGLVALLALLLYIGVGRVSRPILGRIGSWFSSPTEKGNAKLAKEAVDNPSPETVKPLVASLRTNPTFNENFKKAETK